MHRNSSPVKSQIFIDVFTRPFAARILRSASLGRAIHISRVPHFNQIADISKLLQRTSRVAISVNRTTE
jgi:hypothetical protein